MSALNLDIPVWDWYDNQGNMNAINDLRAEIDKIDEQVAKLLAERFLIAQKVGGVKKAENIPLLNIDREIEVIGRVRARASAVISDPQVVDAIEKIYLTVITLTRRLQ